MKRLLVANRGEIACRIMRTCRRLGIETVAVHSEADAASMHVALADRAMSVGGAPAADSYLVAPRIIEAARASGADAVHPGYGFLAENAGFATAVAEAGLLWVGPEPKSMEDMGDKERARLLAKSAGVPVLPGSARFPQGDLAGLDEAAREVGFPLLVKASAGGGGIGMRRVERVEDLAQAVESTQAMAARAFGDGTIYLERYIAEARHVEVQVFGFGDGRALHLSERDCSIQRRFQKIVEESPAPGLAAATRDAMCGAAVALCRQERYRGAGTIEFVVDAETQQFWFLEMNTRIQVEHPVTEMNTGLDLVELQIRLAEGRALPVTAQHEIRASGHAIECRLYAERPAKGFLPSTGTLAKFRMPGTSAQLRIDSGVREGDRISHYYDPMIAKIVAHGRDRDEAIDRMLGALAEIEIEGVETNARFLRRVLEHPAFRAGEVRTGFVDRHKAALLS